MYNNRWRLNIWPIKGIFYGKKGNNMKILKAGKTYKKKCNKCGCYFEYNDGDVKISSLGVNIFAVDKIEWYDVVSCPHCRREIVLG